jgi:predicted nucleic acid-binding protein
MKKVFVDTNIIIDLLADRAPFARFAIELFDSAEKEKVKLFASTHSFATTYYLLKKFFEEKELRKLLASLLDYLELISVDTDIIKKSLLSNHRDFEDTIQMFAAGSITGMDYIVTRNLKDFKGSGIMVLPPEEIMPQL